MANNTIYPRFEMDPILPPATLVSRPPLFPFIGDQHLPYVLPQIVYWLIGISFHYMEVNGLCSSYKLHTPAEFLKRNRVTRTQVVRTALTQQFFMCVFGYLMSEKAELTHTHAYGVAVWANRLRVVPRMIPVLLRVSGVDNQKLGIQIGGNFGALIAKGSLNYCLIVGPATQLSDSCLRSMTNFSRLEMVGAAVFYWVVIPSLQFLTSLFLADTMQYMTHRALHNIPFLYSQLDNSSLRRSEADLPAREFSLHASRGVCELCIWGFLQSSS
jgi:sphinganine C4-monooxygenase